MFGLKFGFQQSTIILKRPIKFLWGPAECTGIVRYFFGDHEYSGRRLASLYFRGGDEGGPFPAEPFFDEEKLDDLIQYNQSVMRLIEPFRSRYSDPRKVRPIGFFQSILIELRMMVAEPISEFSIVPLFGAKQFKIQVYYLSKYNDIFISITVVHSGLNASTYFNSTLFADFDWVIRNLRSNM